MTDPSPDEALIAAAASARTYAHCPYSGFAVGCAVEAADGRRFVGANVENASFTLGLCAERVAVFSALAAGVREIVRIAIVTGAAAPTPPCGACRQILCEFAPDARLVMATTGGKRDTATPRALLPHAFGPEYLGRNARKA